MISSEKLSTLLRDKKSGAALSSKAILIVLAITILPLVVLAILTSSKNSPIKLPILQTAQKTATKEVEAKTISEPQKVSATEPTISDNKVQDNKAQFDKAEASLISQLNEQPDNVSLHNQLGLLYDAKGQLANALEHFHKAVDLCRQNLDSLQAQMQTAKLSEEDKSKLLLETSKVKIDLAAAHSNLARVYEKLGQKEKVVQALDNLKAETSLDKNDKDITYDQKMSPEVVKLVASSHAHVVNGKYADAQKALNSAIKLQPEQPFPHHQLGLLGVITNNPQLALAELKKAEQLSPSDATVHNNLGLTYQALGNYSQAESEFARAQALDPKLAEASINLGTLMARRGDLRAAQGAFQQAIKANPKSSAGHNNLATILSMQGNYSSAIEEFKKAIDLNPNTASSHYGLGLALYNTQNYIAAIAEFKNALRLSPGLTEAQDKIERAQRQVSRTIASEYSS